MRDSARVKGLLRITVTSPASYLHKAKSVDAGQLRPSVCNHGREYARVISGLADVRLALVLNRSFERHGPHGVRGVIHGIPENRVRHIFPGAALSQRIWRAPMLNWRAAPIGTN